MSSPTEAPRPRAVLVSVQLQGVTDADQRSSLKELAGQDAFYIFRLSRGSNSKEFDTQNLHWWDNIFLQRFGDPSAGLNRNRVVIGNELQPATPYVYFTEITDGNAMGEPNICVFQPHQSFTT